MNGEERAIIRSLPTAVPGLDTVLGGGIPEYSFNLIAGGPGSGKTTLAHQIMFANATAERPALYFTVLGEPTLKMLRYQRQFTYFNPELAGSAIQFINLSAEVLERDLDDVLQRIISEIERTKPGIVVVDSFRTIAGYRHTGEPGIFDLDQFVQRLALHLTTWEVTSFLLGEYAVEDQRNPVFTVADGILWLTQATDRNSVVRKLQVVKSRGRAPMPGLHTFRITDDGLQVFPRIPEQTRQRASQKRERLSTGVPGMDEMIGGGVIAGDAIMLTGPAGSGKSTVATQFMLAGLAAGETGVIAVFEEYPEEYIARANARNPQVGKMIAERKLEVIYLRPLDLSVDQRCNLAQWLARHSLVHCAHRGLRRQLDLAGGADAAPCSATGHGQRCGDCFRRQVVATLERCRSDRGRIDADVRRLRLDHVAGPNLDVDHLRHLPLCRRLSRSARVDCATRLYCARRFATGECGVGRPARCARDAALHGRDFLGLHRVLAVPDHLDR